MTNLPIERYTGSETLGMVDPKMIPQAVKVMNECLDQLVHIFAQGDKTEPYHIAVNMFSLKKKLGKENL